MGRSSKYDEKYHVPLVRGLARRGYTCEEIASELGIAKKTLYAWRNKHPELRIALKEGRDFADMKVEESLYHRALGYKVTEKRTIIGTNPDGGQQAAKIEIIEKELPPDPAAMIFWLKNRNPSLWRDHPTNMNVDDKPMIVDDIPARVIDGSGKD